MLFRGTLFLNPDIMFFQTMTFNYGMRRYDEFFGIKSCVVKNAEKAGIPIEKMNLKMGKKFCFCKISFKRYNLGWLVVRNIYISNKFSKLFTKKVLDLLTPTLRVKKLS